MDKKALKSAALFCAVFALLFANSIFAKEYTSYYDFVPGFGVPVAATHDPVSMNPSGAVFEGELTDLGVLNSASVYFIYYEAQNPVPQYTKKGLMTAEGIFYSEPIKLDPAKKYCIVAMAENAQGMSQSNPVCPESNAPKPLMGKTSQPSVDYFSNPTDGPSIETAPVEDTLLGNKITSRVSNIKSAGALEGYYEITQQAGKNKIFQVKPITILDNKETTLYLDKAFSLNNTWIQLAVKNGNTFVKGNIVGQSTVVTKDLTDAGKALPWQVCYKASGKCQPTKKTFRYKEDCEKDLASDGGLTSGVCYNTTLSCSIACDYYKPENKTANECYRKVWIKKNKDGSAYVENLDASRVNYGSTAMAKIGIDVFFKQGGKLAAAQCQDVKDPAGTWYFCIKNRGECRPTFGVQQKNKTWVNYKDRATCEAAVKKWWGSQAGATCYQDEQVCNNICQEYVSPTVKTPKAVFYGNYEDQKDGSMKLYFTVISLGNAKTAKVRIQAKLGNSLLIQPSDWVQVNDRGIYSVNYSKMNKKYWYSAYAEITNGVDPDYTSQPVYLLFNRNEFMCPDNICGTGENSQNCPQDCTLPFEKCYKTICAGGNCDSQQMKALAFVAAKNVNVNDIIKAEKLWEAAAGFKLFNKVSLGNFSSVTMYNGINEISYNPKYAWGLGVAAHALPEFLVSSTGKRYMMSCDIEINNTEGNDYIYYENSSYLDRTMGHEVGHCLGLDDLYNDDYYLTRCPEEIMNNSSYSIGRGDRAGLKEVYGK